MTCIFVAPCMMAECDEEEQSEGFAVSFQSEGCATKPKMTEKALEKLQKCIALRRRKLETLTSTMKEYDVLMNAEMSNMCKKQWKMILHC